MPLNPRVVTALMLLCALVAGTLVLLGRAARDAGTSEATITPSSRFEGALMPPGVRAPDFVLRDERGREVSMHELRGQVVVVSFLYATCEDTCPAQAQLVKGALDQLGRDVPALAVSVEPGSDTAEAARRFNAEQRMVGRLRWVLGDRTQLRQVWRGFAIQPQEARVEHQARIVLVDRRGMQRIGFPVSLATPDALAHDIRLLAGERPGA